jgi:hypothetical protein
MNSGETNAAPASTVAVSADPHATNMQRLVDAVLAGPGTLDQSMRRAAAEGAQVPEALRAAGYSEDQIFEATVSCALGACLRRLEAGLSAIDRGA